MKRIDFTHSRGAKNAEGIYFLLSAERPESKNQSRFNVLGYSFKYNACFNGLFA
jgi:hypothetical protein